MTTKSVPNDSKTIEVRNIQSPEIDEEVLRDYFSDKKKSGGGPIESLIFHRYLKKAIIVFVNQADARNTDYKMYHNIPVSSTPSFISVKVCFATTSERNITLYNTIGTKEISEDELTTALLQIDWFVIECNRDADDGSFYNVKYRPNKQSHSSHDETKDLTKLKFPQKETKIIHATRDILSRKSGPKKDTKKTSENNMYDSEGKDNSTSSESNSEFLPHKNFNQDTKVITSSIESKSDSFQQSNVDERGRKSPTLRKSNRAPSKETKIDDKVSKTKFPSHEPTETHAKHYTESDKSTDLRKVKDQVSKDNSLSSESNLSTTDVKHATENVESTDLRERTENTSSTMPNFTFSQLHNDNEPGVGDNQSLPESNSALKKGTKFSGSKNPTCESNSDSFLNNVDETGNKENPESIKSHYVLLQQTKFDNKVSKYNSPLSKSNFSTTTDAKYTTESVESTDLRKKTGDQITPAVGFDIKSTDESNTLQHSVPQGKQIDSFNDTTDTSQKDCEETERTKSGKSEEDEGKKDEIIAGKQALQSITTKQSNDSNQDMTLTEIKEPILNVVKKTNNHAEDLAQVIQLAAAINDNISKNSNTLEYLRSHTIDQCDNFVQVKDILSKMQQLMESILLSNQVQSSQKSVAAQTTKLPEKLTQNIQTIETLTSEAQTENLQPHKKTTETQAPQISMSETQTEQLPKSSVLCLQIPEISICGVQTDKLPELITTYTETTSKSTSATQTESLPQLQMVATQLPETSSKETQTDVRPTTEAKGMPMSQQPKPQTSSGSLINEEKKLVVTNIKPSERRKQGRDINNDTKEGTKPENADASVKSNSSPKIENQVWNYFILTRIDKEFTKIELAFQRSMNPASNKIIQINRIDNQTLLDSYEAKREEIATEKYLWHGTSVKETPSGLVPIVNINARGFNRSYSGSSTGAVYGDGVYFAVDASTSAKYCKPHDGKRYMYYCKVLTGEYTIGKAGLKESPMKDVDTHEWFDSVVDNAESPTMFIIGNDTQAYPEYLVTFTCDADK